MHKLIDSENHRNVNRGQSMDFEEVMWVKKGLTIAFVVNFVGRLSKKKTTKPVEILASRHPQAAIKGVCLRDRE
jgi:hypothetical protein